MSGKLLDKNAVIGDAIQDGCDLFVEESVREVKIVLTLQDNPVKCGRPGCDKSYKESENHDSACNYHPGPPIFHEGYKGWKCCDRKTTDFEEFLSFEGCAVGRHIPHVPQAKVPTNCKFELL